MKIRSLLFPLVVASLALSLGSVEASKIQKDLVAADAKWVAHLDVDAFRSSQVGQRLFEKSLKKGMEDIQGVLSMDLKADLYDKIGGITIYGNELTTNVQNNFVAIVKATPEASTALEKLLEAVKGFDPNAVQRADENSSILYTLNNETYLSIKANQPWIISNQKENVEAASKSLSAGGKTMGSNAAFPDAATPGILQVIALGIVDLKGLPDQAKLVQKNIQDVTLGVSESGDKINLDVLLKSQTAESTTQLKQFVDGLIGLLALTQASNVELQELLKATKVTEANQAVSLKATVPLSKAMELIDAMPAQQ